MRTRAPRHWYLIGAPRPATPGHPAGPPLADSLDADSAGPGGDEFVSRSPAVLAATNFVTAFILYGYLIPISLYVSIEMVKIVQSMVFIAGDREMYDPASDTPAVARTSNLNEELGMVTTVLSDKKIGRAHV